MMNFQPSISPMSIPESRQCDHMPLNSRDGTGIRRREREATPSSSRKMRCLAAMWARTFGGPPTSLAEVERHLNAMRANRDDVELLNQHDALSTGRWSPPHSSTATPPRPGSRAHAHQHHRAVAARAGAGRTAGIHRLTTPSGINNSGPQT